MNAPQFDVAPGTCGVDPACDATPTCTSGIVYSAPVSIMAGGGTTTNTTLKAIGCKNGYANSSISSGLYKIDKTPPAQLTGLGATPAETEVKYQLWLAVRTWSIGNGYTFANPGVMGDGSGDTDQHPVTTVTWRDAMVWTNALTEWYNAKTGSSYDCVYCTSAGFTTPIRASTNSDGDIMVYGEYRRNFDSGGCNKNGKRSRNFRYERAMHTSGVSTGIRLIRMPIECYEVEAFRIVQTICGLGFIFLIHLIK